MNIVFQIIYLVLHNTDKGLHMIKNIVACVCSECGDTWDYGKLIKEDYTKALSEWMTTPKTCLRCGKKYIPIKNIYNMDEFVFNSVRNCKM